MKYVNFDYRGARNMSWEILIQFQVSRLPVRVSDICKRAGFILRNYIDGAQGMKDFGLEQQTKISDGFATIKNGRYYIFYNKYMTAGRVRFTIAHELGHIFMGHIREEGQVTRRNQEPEEGDLPIEHEANVFASRLLAPAYVLHDLGTLTVERISKVCDISMQSALYRTERMEVLEQRKRYGTARKEREMRAQFENYIQEMNGSG